MKRKSLDTFFVALELLKWGLKDWGNKLSSRKFPKSKEFSTSWKKNWCRIAATTKRIKQGTKKYADYNYGRFISINSMTKHLECDFLNKINAQLPIWWLTPHRANPAVFLFFYRIKQSFHSFYLFIGNIFERNTNFAFICSKSACFSTFLF